jgi:hypothetical protein
MDFLNLDQIKSVCPSALTTSPSEKVSHLYRFIPTTEVMDILSEEGWLPVKATQRSARKKTEDLYMYKKHLIRFRNPENDYIGRQIGDTFPEIVLTNSHDGTSSFNFDVGLFRLVCTNGLVVADQKFDSMRILHKGFEKADVIKVIEESTKRIPLIVGTVDKMINKEMSMAQQVGFAKDAVEMRWGSDKIVDINQILSVRRPEDSGNDLWSVFNRVQENMLQGGIVTITPKDNGSVRRSTSRAIRSIEQNVSLNKMLWTLSESLV